MRAAVDLADRDGIEALSMRRLARELGVEAMSLYNHVANKDEILDRILDAIVDEIELPAGADWKIALRRNAISARDALVRHRWASSLWMTRQNPGPARLQRADWTLRRFRDGGLPPELRYHAFHILEAYVLGVTFQHLSVTDDDQDLPALAEAFLRQLPAEDYPDFAEHVRQHLDPPAGHGGFELGLDLILDGLERMRDRS